VVVGAAKPDDDRADHHTSSRHTGSCDARACKAGRRRPLI